MLLSDDSPGTSDELTEDSAAPGFETYLSDVETQEESEANPTQQSPESDAPESAAVEASTEPADVDEDQPDQPDEESEEAAEAPADDEDSLDPTVMVKVKIDGVEEQVTLEEALKGYSRTSVFTRKTQELAEQRKAFEAEHTGVRDERQVYATRLGQLEQAIRNATPQEPDWDKVQNETPEAFANLRAQWSLHNERMAAITAQRQQAEQAVQKDQAVAREQYLAAEQEKVIEALPEWKTPEVAKAAKTEMVSYVKNMGYSVEEISQVTDSRLIVLISKVMKFDKAQKNKPAITERIQKVKVATPGPTTGKTPTKSKGEMARQRLAKTGGREEAEAAFAAFLDEEE